MDAPAVDRQAGLPERTLPGKDVRVDRVDQGAVKIKDECSQGVSSLNGLVGAATSHPPSSQPNGRSLPNSSGPRLQPRPIRRAIHAHDQPVRARRQVGRQREGVPVAHELAGGPVLRRDSGRPAAAPPARRRRGRPRPATAPRPRTARPAPRPPATADSTGTCPPGATVVAGEVASISASGPKVASAGCIGGDGSGRTTVTSPRRRPFGVRARSPACAGQGCPVAGS